MFSAEGRLVGAQRQRYRIHTNQKKRTAENRRPFCKEYWSVELNPQRLLAATPRYSKDYGFWLDDVGLFSCPVNFSAPCPWLMLEGDSAEPVPAADSELTP